MKNLIDKLKVGSIVISKKLGEGIVASFVPYGEYPISVSYGNGNNYAYSKDGEHVIGETHDQDIQKKWKTETVEDRIEVYQEMLEVYEHMKDNGNCGYPGFCALSVNLNIKLIDLLELYKVAPRYGAINGNAYWFNNKDCQSRINCLNGAIHECHTFPGKNTLDIKSMSIDRLEQLKELIDKEFEERSNKQLYPKWEDLKVINGYYIDDKSDILETLTGGNNETSKHIWPDRKYAEAALALSQLLRLRNAYNNLEGGDGKITHWYYIWLMSNNQLATAFNEKKYVVKQLTFKSLDLCENFLKNNKELLEIAKPLL